MYELKKNFWKVFTSKFVGTGPSSYEKRIYRAAVSQSLRNTALVPCQYQNFKKEQNIVLWGHVKMKSTLHQSVSQSVISKGKTERSRFMNIAVQLLSMKLTPVCLSAAILTQPIHSLVSQDITSRIRYRTLTYGIAMLWKRRGFLCGVDWWGWKITRPIELY